MAERLWALLLIYYRVAAFGVNYACRLISQHNVVGVLRPHNKWLGFISFIISHGNRSQNTWIFLVNFV